MSDDALLEVRDLRTEISLRWGALRAVDGVSFSLRAGETLGIVGESGSGKSLTALSIMRLLPRGAEITGGEVLFEGRDMTTLSERDMERIRGKRISLILQDPHTSLHPSFRVGDQVIEAIRQGNGTGKGGRRDVRERAVALLRSVGIPEPERRMANYPHEMSGGMKQRVVGAIAIANDPALLIADEPTTALDVTLQAQYLRLLRDIQRRTNVAMIFITHDFGVVARICHRVAVMYAGRVIEEAGVREIFERPAHPYTQGLIKSVPTLTETTEGPLYSIGGHPPDPFSLPVGCRFAPRCSYYKSICDEYPPGLPAGERHVAHCWRCDPSWPDR